MILNKTDLPPVVSDEEARALLPEAVLIEAAVGQNIGITKLEYAIENVGYGGRVKQQDSVLVSNVRHIAPVSYTHLYTFLDCAVTAWSWR